MTKRGRKAAGGDELVRRVQLTLPEIKSLVQTLLDDVAETLRVRDALAEKDETLTLAAVREAAPKIKRLVKLVEDTEQLEEKATAPTKGKTDA